MNENPNNTLTKLRGAIDAIDDELVALLKKRSGIVAQVGTLKNATTPRDCHIRSGREADMHLAMYQRFIGSGFHPEAALAIWRHIITASTHMESPLCVASPAALVPLAIDYFGSYTPCLPLDNHVPDNANIIFAPMPDAANAPLWNMLLAAGNDWQVFSYAPLLSNDGVPKALLLARIEAEASGQQDISYFVGGTPPASATLHAANIWSVPEYVTHYESARFLGAHATPMIRKEQP